jgi:abortive infection bacteriophage resistance protein
MLKSAGRFLYMDMARLPFIKTYSSPAQLASILQSRGLHIDNKIRVENYLRTIGYYRLSAYLYPLLKLPKEQHQFKIGSTFDQALDMYRFDRHLRLLLFNQIEKIEIAVRSSIVNITSKETGDPFWITNPANFANKVEFQKTLSLIKSEYNRSREDFIKHFRVTYSNQYPPAWIIAEILPIGVLTSIFKNLASHQVRKKIAKEFDLNVPVFNSWMTIITLTRNSCCHHARVWNRDWSLQTRTMRRMNRPWISASVKQGKIFYTLCIIKYFINIIAPTNDMTGKIIRLLAEYPNIDISAMGFSANWNQEEVWQ